MLCSSHSVSFLFRRQIRRKSGGFSLIELLVVIAIMVILGALTLPNFVGINTAKVLANNAYQLAGIFQQARTTAMSENTYVAVGLYQYNSPDGVPCIAVGVVSSPNGLLNGLLNGTQQTVTTVTKPIILRNVKIDPNPNQDYLTLSGANAGGTDVPSSSIVTYNFTLPILGNPTPVTFSNVIVFSPTGEAGLAPQTSTPTLLQPDDCLGLGLVASPSKNNHYVGIQIYGLSGQVSVYQQ